MEFSFLTPISNQLQNLIHNLPQQAIGKHLDLYTKKNTPNFDNAQFALIGVAENRNALNNDPSNIDFTKIRTAFYSLFPGNWATNIVDLGNLLPGETVQDTYFALNLTLSSLYKQGIIPIIIGGSQDLTYSQYRAFDTVTKMINIVNIDTSFDLGDANLPINSKSYMGKIVVEKPYNLFNYTTIGYQTYFNSQEELDLLEKLFFEAYRLGEVTNNINLVEPLLRDAHLVTIDLKAIKAAEVGLYNGYSPNGFSGKEICALARYAGISNKVASLGIYEYQNYPNPNLSEALIAQIIWYFIEGFNCRIEDQHFNNTTHYQKYNVLVDDLTLVFKENLKTERWWIEIPYLNQNNKLNKNTLLPCSKEDYLQALEGIIPERWYKMNKKNNF